MAAIYTHEFLIRSDVSMVKFHQRSMQYWKSVLCITLYQRCILLQFYFLLLEYHQQIHLLNMATNGIPGELVAQIWPGKILSKTPKRQPLSSEARDRTYLFIVRTRTDPTFWPFFVRTYLPTPTYLFSLLNINFIEKLQKSKNL